MKDELQQKNDTLPVNLKAKKKEPWNMEIPSDQFKTIVQSAFDGIIIYDKKGIILDANDSAAELFNTTKDALVSQKLTSIIPEIPSQGCGEIELPNPINSVTRLEFTLTNGFMPNANVIFLRDMSDRIIERKRRDHFLDIAAHEIKTPLASIKAYVQIMQKNAPPEFKEYLKKTDEKANMVTRLINELLDVTRIRQNRLNFIYAICNIDQLTQEITQEFSHTYPDHTIVISGSTGKEIIADKARITQVISNVLKNAIKYSPSKKKIYIDLSSTKKEVRISIRDNGIGILPENVKKVSTLYFRSQKGENIAPGGLGVGLFISSQIVKRHGGSISVTSKIGKGSTFTITLPIRPKGGKNGKKSSAR